MTTIDDLIPIFKKLRLSGVLQTLELRLQEAIDDDLGHIEFLYRSLTDEVERRDAKQMALRLRRARFEQSKTIEDFDFRFNPSVPKSRIIDLATCLFVERREVVCLVGHAGTGKSHLAQALGHRACMAGHSVLYTPAHQMFRQLRASRADRSFDRCLLKFTSPQLLIIDDLGLRPLRDHEPEDLYEIIRHRYERSALVITSNRSVSEWYPLFGDELLASAAMDRLLHHSVVVELTGNSYRNPPGAPGRSRGGQAA